MSRRKKPPQPAQVTRTTSAPPTDASPPPPAARRQPGKTLIVCALLLAFFAGIAWFAVDSKSPTYDEPLHALGAWLHLRIGDFRVNPEDPPLWHYWAALPNGRGALNPRMDERRFKQVADDVFMEWIYVVDVLYRTAGNDGEAIVRRSRAMMLIVGVALGAAVAWWSWRLGGAVAAVAATAAFALDPNFIAHAPLVKNDVSLTLVMLLLAIAVWRAGIRLTRWNGLAIGLLCGAGLNVKFSGLLLGPIVLALLLIRAAMPSPWPVLGRELHARGRKVLAALAVCAVAAVISYVSIWACYGFRFRPTPEPGVLLNTQNVLDYLRVNELGARLTKGELRREDVENWRPGPLARSILFFEDHRLLPQAWLNGLLYTQQSAVIRKTFLLGEVSFHGRWYYFPVAMAIKSPLGLIAGALCALGIGVLAWRRGGRAMWREHGWTISAFAVPVGVFLLASMSSNLNIGLRHVLPVYPFVFVAVGVAAAYAWRLRPKATKIAAAILVIVLGTETLAAFPNYVAFFNAAAGGNRGGIRLLGDSNLDWGQDLKLLAQWQQDHPGQTLYLAYFGLADPAYYGVTYRNLPGAYQFGPTYEPPRAPGVVAISATHLQGIYQEDDMLRVYRTIGRQLEPIEVLGGTIYLYDALDVVQLLSKLPPPKRPPTQPAR